MSDTSIQVFAIRWIWWSLHWPFHLVTESNQREEKYSIKVNVQRNSSVQFYALLTLMCCADWIDQVQRHRGQGENWIIYRRIVLMSNKRRTSIGYILNTNRTDVDLSMWNVSIFNAIIVTSFNPSLILFVMVEDFEVDVDVISFFPIGFLPLTLLVSFFWHEDEKT